MEGSAQRINGSRRRPCARLRSVCARLIWSASSSSSSNKGLLAGESRRSLDVGLIIPLPVALSASREAQFLAKLTNGIHAQGGKSQQRIDAVSGKRVNHIRPPCPGNYPGELQVTVRLLSTDAIVQGHCCCIHDTNGVEHKHALYAQCNEPSVMVNFTF